MVFFGSVARNLVAVIVSLLLVSSAHGERQEPWSNPNVWRPAQFNGDCVRISPVDRESESQGGSVPSLPGLHLVDPDMSSWQGQIIYLDLDGAQDVVYNGPVTVGPFDIPVFQAPGILAGWERTIIADAVSQLEQTFADSGILFTVAPPAPGQAYSTIYVGGDDSVFSRYGSFRGLAEQVDAGNADRGDVGLVFSGQLADTSIGGYVTSLAEVIAHEAGHLLGYAHAGCETGAGVLQSVAAWEGIVGEKAPGVRILGEMPDCWFSPTEYCVNGHVTEIFGRPVSYNMTLTVSGYTVETRIYEGTYNPLGQVAGFRETRLFQESGRTYEITIWNVSYNSLGRVTGFSAMVEGDLSIETSVDSVTVPEDSTGTFQVKLSAQPDSDVVVGVSWVSGDGDIAVTDGSSLTFTTSDWDTYQTVTLSAAPDADAANGTATIRCSASGLANKDVTASEQDSTPLLILTDRDAVTVPENETATFQVKLSAEPGSSVVVAVSWVDGDSDIGVIGGSTLEFTTSNWDSYQTVTLLATDDVDAANGTATIRCSESGATDRDVAASEMDDDPLTIVTSVDSVTVPDGTGLMFGVRLSAQPASNVVVTVSRVDGDSDISVMGGSSLTFTVADWNIERSVTLWAAKDADTEDGTATIRLSAAGLPDKDVIVTEQDGEGQAWSAYVGGSDYEESEAIAADASGNIYMTGYTVSSAWATSGFDSTLDGSSDAFVAKFTASGAHLWSTYVGGGNAEYGYAIATDLSGCVYVGGDTYSSDWMTGGLDTTLDGERDAFLVKLGDVGEYLWGTYVGGLSADAIRGIAVDDSGCVYVTGYTDSSGWISGGFDESHNGDWDAFVVKFNSNGEHLWSTYLGSSGYDIGYGIAVDASGDVYVAGYTNSPGWTRGGFDTEYNGGAYDVFVAKLSSSGEHLWSTYLGGDGHEESCDIAVDASGNVYVTGWTESAGWTNGGFDTEYGGARDGFVAKLSSSGEHLWSTYLGAHARDDGYGIAVGSSGGVYVTGVTWSGGWTSGGFDTTDNGEGDPFVAKLNSSGTHLWSTYLGGSSVDHGLGIAVDSSGGIYVSGVTSSSGWTSGVFGTIYNGGGDAFVAKIIDVSVDEVSILTDADSLTVPEASTRTFGVKLSAQPDSEVLVSVSWVSGDSDISVTGGSSLTFTTVDWDTYQTVTLSAAEDVDVANGTATIRCSASGLSDRDVTATEEDNDSLAIVTSVDSLTLPEGLTAEFGVKLSAQPDSDVVVTVSWVSGDADISVIGGSGLTFTTVTWDSYQTVTLSAAEDADATNGTTTIRCSASGLSDRDVTATEADTDSLAIVTSTDSVAVPEGSGSTFEVKLSAQPDSDVVVSVSWASGDSDISVTGGSSLTFTTVTWDSYQTVTLSAAEDADATNGMATIHCSALGLADVDVTATEQDNDPRLVVLHDWNGDGIVSIVGDVPAFVQCVYFSTCPDDVDTIAVGDCNHDGILSIVGDVPCFVQCVYFDDCPD
ncbi:MAG: SBBP repeat-containing protein [Phycisphaerales bacterium]